MTSAQETQLKEQQDDIFNHLVVEGREDRVRIPEQAFKEHFLPYFTGERPLESGDNVIANWIGIVGAPMAEAAVVDVAGNVLYTVPPVLDSSAIDITRKQLKSFGSVTSMTMLKENHIKGEGICYFLEQTGQMEKTLISPQEDRINENARRWKEIRDRYAINGGAPEKTKEVTQQNNDDFEYD